MGIHIMTFAGQSKRFQWHYFNDYDELIQFKEDYPDDAIVYEADEKWKPAFLKDYPALQNYTNSHLRAGRRGELLFKAMADENNFIAQEIDQNKDYYQRFKKIMGDNVKRSDYIILNLPDVEVDVKCLTKKFDSADGAGYYVLEVQEIERFKRYMDKTGRKIIFAIYPRVNNWPDRGNLGMVELSDLLNQKQETHWKKLCIRIPCSLLTPSFLLLEHHAKEKVLSQKKAGFSTASIQNEDQPFFPLSEKELIVDQELLQVDSKINQPNKNFSLQVKSWLGKFSKTLLVDLMLLPGFMLAMTILSMSIKDSNFSQYTMHLQCMLGLLFFMLLLQSSKKHFISSVSTALVGGRIAFGLSRKGHFLLFSKPYFILLALMGIIGLFRYVKCRIE